MASPIFVHILNALDAAQLEELSDPELRNLVDDLDRNDPGGAYYSFKWTCVPHAA